MKERNNIKSNKKNTTQQQLQTKPLKTNYHNKKKPTLAIIIARSLARPNSKEIRVLAFDCLLYFIEALQNSFEQKQIDLFASALNLQPFVEGTEQVQFKNLPGK
jgi:hypothetical protein